MNRSTVTNIRYIWAALVLAGLTGAQSPANRPFTDPAGMIETTGNIDLSKDRAYRRSRNPIDRRPDEPNYFQERTRLK